MKRFPVSRTTAIAAFATALLVLTPSTAVAKKPSRGGGGGGGGSSTTSTYVKNYANVVNGAEFDVAPQDVQATADGGWTALATTSVSAGAGVSWLQRASATGAPQWQEDVGCLSGAPGDYADLVSLQQTTGGGYVAAGGTIGCGSGSNCPELSGFTCGLVETFTSGGAVVWARAYSAGADGTSFHAVRPTSDGGFVAVGAALAAGQVPGALIVKLDANGNVEWQRQLAPTSATNSQFEAVQPTSDGGFVAVGQFADGSTSNPGVPQESALAAKFDAAGNLIWEKTFNDVGSTGVTATEHINTIVQAADGGLVVGGDWNDSNGPGTCCQGALLFKLTAAGSLQWQHAYSGGVYCFDNGYSETCSDIGGGVYSIDPTADGGYILAGDSTLEMLDETPLVPWLAKVDANGSLVWQENDYQANSTTGRPLSEYFAASALTATGPLAIGETENYSAQRNELLAAQTDANGAVGTCSQVHPASTLVAVDPGLAALGSVPAEQTTASQSSSPSPVQTQPTSATGTAPQC